MVMTGIPMDSENLIYKLSYSEANGYKAINEELYGLDASTIMELALHTTPRSKDVEAKLNELFDFIESERYGEATEMLRVMQGEFGDKLPELAKAEAMLTFLNNENDQDQ
jgi:hypothetical protein